VRILVLGGARSGKSGFAEALLADAAEVDYVATAAHDPSDEEWTARIRAHQQRRPSGWRTLETDDLRPVLETAGPAVLVDSITLWVARSLESAGPPGSTTPAHQERAEQLCSLWVSTPRHVVAVSDEVGQGVVPETPAGRRFRDELGLLNQRLAATADEVHLVVAGIPLRLR
jgi:adenosylcobinamide kinase/adenosylcobinamide-phosphate guanylyltransferase